ncbi:serine/threonine-protein kinase [Nonomuraea sp. NPDC000554]|uniref:serine/threonine-protein kinase n=1 Tax=Nonomuraea sp. NPDC000554 TaxID=3154259 RepID=UPI0033222295
MAVGALRSGDPGRLGEHAVVGRLGQGGQGVVYLAETPGGERVAIKVMTGDLDRSFERELAAARQVAEFCTARVIAADLDHDPPYVVSEYIDGPSLAAVGPLGGAALIRLAIGTATALTAIHRAGVVHRDFKPANVLMAPDGPRVIDFGIARLSGLTASHSQLAGTPRYMAPEQFGDGPVGAPTDMFAWGSTMVFAASGRPPFRGDSIAAVAYQILQAEPDLGDLSAPLRGLVARCLAKDPAVRPTARDVLLELVGEHGAAELDLTTVEAGLPRVSRRGLLVGAGAVLAAAATSGVLLWRRAAGGTTSAPPAASGSPAAVTASPSGPAAEPRALMAAIQTALGATPMADLTYEGGLSQSSFNANATGRLVYDLGAGSATNAVSYDLSVLASATGDKRVRAAVIRQSAAYGIYINGRKTKERDPSEIVAHVRLIELMASVAMLTELVALTPAVRRSGRVYTGSLHTVTTPQTLQDILMEIAGGWTQKELAKTTLNWKVELDPQDRPVSYLLVWRYPIEGDMLTSTWETRYSHWRSGTITAPQ